ncbi:MAG: ferritin-like domain-containing protein [Actinomycetota bacterium]|nr:ferritin-like domain-containing protein [Actinomycetota bacterium]
MGDEEEKLDVEGAIKCLNDALRLQYRSALGYTLAAGGMFGFEYQGFSSQLADFGRVEIDDTRRLVEKITTFEGAPTTDVAPLSWSEKPEDVVDALIEGEQETIEALQAAIEPTGREGLSEALEHLLEHLILRKQNQVDFLIRARRRP